MTDVEVDWLIQERAREVMGIKPPKHILVKVTWEEYNAIEQDCIKHFGIFHGKIAGAELTICDE